MKQNWWGRFKKRFNIEVMAFLALFAAEDRFIRGHKHGSSQITEQKRYGIDDKDDDR